MAAQASLKGVWKLSATLRQGSAARAAAAIPKRIRFDEERPLPQHAALLAPRVSVLDAGSCSIPFMEHCGGGWELAAATDEEDTSGALRACFVVDDSASRLTFEGLFDGERIAGTVLSADEPIGDFLCTRLFTFWGAPKVRAGASGG